MVRKRIYVAGPYSCANRCKPYGIDLEWMRKGLDVSTMLIKKGYAVFCPWLDYLFHFTPSGPLTKQDYYEYSMSWLAVSDCVYVHAFREGSVGTLAEIKFAEKHGILVFYEAELETMYQFLAETEA